MIAILIPSRARPDRLHTTIKSAVETTNPKNVEIRIRFDDDDKLSLDRIDEFKKYPNCHVHVGNRLAGYNSVNEFYTELADASGASWVSIMNDDATYIGFGWDENLLNVPAVGFIVQPETYQWNNCRFKNNQGGAFPFVPNGSWKKFGPNCIPNPADTALDIILRQEAGWRTHFLQGLTILHLRDTPEELEEHRRKL
jgi:hypothetical protein